MTLQSWLGNPFESTSSSNLLLLLF